MSEFSIATWNVNSLRVRLGHVSDWLSANRPAVLCLQETKVVDLNFPANELHGIGYECAFFGQPTYNGVAILSRYPLADVAFGIPNFADEQKRVIAATIHPQGGGEGMRIISVYVPNGQHVGADKYEYKLRWLAALRDYLKASLDEYKNLAVVGDFNVAPADADVFDPAEWGEDILCSPPERAAFFKLTALGLADAFRLFEQPPNLFSWWDYRLYAFRRNRGLRIDHILLSSSLAEFCGSCAIDIKPREWERPSDHAPVSATFPQFAEN